MTQSKILDLLNFESIYKTNIILSILIYIITIITYYLRNTTISAVLLLVVIVFAIIVNKNSVSYIKNIINKKLGKEGK